MCTWHPRLFQWSCPLCLTGIRADSKKREDTCFCMWKFECYRTSRKLGHQNVRYLPTRCLPAQRPLQDHRGSPTFAWDTLLKATRITDGAFWPFWPLFYSLAKRRTWIQLPISTSSGSCFEELRRKLSGLDSVHVYWRKKVEQSRRT